MMNGINGFKFLDPAGSTHRNGKETVYPLPRPGEKWGPEFIHPDPADPDGEDCGPGRWHVMKRPDARYAPNNWWPWYVQSTGTVLGESSEKYSTTALKLRRISPKVWHRIIRLGWCRRSNLYGGNLYWADLKGANLYGADLERANLYGVDLSEANLSKAKLIKANLRRAYLEGAILEGAIFYGANLSRAKLRRANLRGANLYGADLESADLYEADLSNAKLGWANLSGANLYGAKLEGTDLFGTDLSNADHNVHTVWPDGFDKARLEASRRTKVVDAGENDRVKG
jgi:hypothetical protein